MDAEKPVLTSGKSVIQESFNVSARLDDKISAVQLESYIKIKREMLNIRTRYKIDNTAYNEGKKVFKASRYRRLILQKNGMQNSEYQWIQERIFEASTRLLLDEVYVLNASIIAKLTNLLDFNRKRLKAMAKLADRVQLGKHIAEIAQELAEFEQSHQDRVKITAALQHNMDIVAKRLSELSDLKVVGRLYKKTVLIESLLD